MQRLKYLSVALPLAAVALLVLQGQGGGPASPPEPIALEGVDPAWFTSGEEFLAPFPGEKPAVSEADIRARVKDLFGDVAIRQLVLTHARVPNRVPPIDQLVWLASINMLDEEGPDPDAPTFMYKLAYFDAQTGESVFGAEAWRPKTQGPVATLAPGEIDVPGTPRLSN